MELPHVRVVTTAPMLKHNVVKVYRVVEVYLHKFLVLVLVGGE